MPMKEVQEEYKEALLFEDYGVTTIFDSLIEQFFKQTNPWWMNEMRVPAGRVATDLQEAFAGLDTINDLNEKLFWQQINRFRRQYAKNEKERITALRSVVYFYNYLINKYPEYNLFDDARTLYPSLLANRSFVTEWIEKNYKFMTFSPGIKYEKYDKYVFILRGADNLSSKVKKYDYKVINLSTIESPYYRRCVFDYICADTNRVLQYSPTIFNYTLNPVSELKKNNGYINKSEQYLTTSELAYLIQSLEIRSKGKQEQVQAFLGIFKGFVLWCEKHEYLKYDVTFKNGLSYHRDKAYVPKTKRPEAEHVDTILKASKEKAEKNPSLYLVFDAIIRLLLTAEPRVSAICTLERNCIEKQLKPNSYRLRYIDKTSHGDINQTAPITSREKALIDKVLAFTESLLDKAKPELKGYLFLYVPNRKKYVRCVNNQAVIDYLAMLCEENELPNITPTKLRKEYQSQVKRFSIKENLDDIQEKALSGHSHTQTTDRHYVKVRLEEYFEQMYMVSLHDKNIDNTVSGKVMDTVPEKLEKVGDTTHKCGACNAPSCMVKNALPCFLCKDFITSSEFLPVFKQMADDISSQIYSSPNPHDKEDLTAVKEVLVRYIVELTLKQQQHEQ